LSSDPALRNILRRLKPDKLHTRLEPRPNSQLTFLDRPDRIPKLLLDTTVYVDELQGKIPSTVRVALTSGGIWHSTVTESELAALVGRLDPRHPDTEQTIGEVMSTIDRRPSHRIVNPDRDAWREAGVLAGLLARLQQYGKADQRRVLNDALIYTSAAKAGLTVLTRNVADYDFLMQLAPHGHAIFYERDAN
jgi:predicted nucleic acid-binding protein